MFMYFILFLYFMTVNHIFSANCNYCDSSVDLLSLYSFNIIDFIKNCIQTIQYILTRIVY